MEHCFVPDVVLLAVGAPITQPSRGVDRWWTQDPTGRYRLLRVPDCTLEDAPLPAPTLQAGGVFDFLLAFQFAASDGAVLLERRVPRTAGRTWWLLAGPADPLRAVDGPAGDTVSPILSDAGDAVAWIERVPGSNPPAHYRVRIRPVRVNSSFAGADIELAPFGAASYSLHGVDVAAREVVLWRNDRPRWNRRTRRGSCIAT